MNQEEYSTINIRDIWMILYHKLPIILVAGILGALLGLGYITKMVTPLYQANATLIVNTQQDANTAITNDQYSSASKWAATYSIIIKSDTVLEEVIKNLNLNCSFEQISKMVQVSTIDNTQVLRLTVTGTSEDTAYRIADELTRVIPEILEDKVGAASVKVVSNARAVRGPVNMGKNKYVSIGAAIGLALACLVVLLVELLDDKVRSEEDLARIFQVPVLGVIPECSTEE